MNVQHAMHLTAHSDPRVHARYVMQTSAMRAIPKAAIPRLSVAALREATALLAAFDSIRNDLDSCP